MNLNFGRLVCLVASLSTVVSCSTLSQDLQRTQKKSFRMLAGVVVVTAATMACGAKYFVLKTEKPLCEGENKEKPFQLLAAGSLEQLQDTTSEMKDREKRRRLLEERDARWAAYCRKQKKEQEEEQVKKDKEILRLRTLNAKLVQDLQVLEDQIKVRGYWDKERTRKELSTPQKTTKATRTGSPSPRSSKEGSPTAVSETGGIKLSEVDLLDEASRIA